MNKTRITIAGALVAALALAAAPAVNAVTSDPGTSRAQSAAQPAAPTCPSPTANPANATGAQTAKTESIAGGERKVQLRYGWINGVQYAWARVIPYHRAGDVLWVDYDNDGVGNPPWAPHCGIVRLGNDNRWFSNAIRTSSNPDIVMRAAISPAGGDDHVWVTHPWW